MRMKRDVPYIILGVTAFVFAMWLTQYVTTSNLLLTSASAHFSPDPKGLNKLQIKAPYGWYCVTFYRVPSMFDHKMQVMGKSSGACPLFGLNTIWASYYPDSGGMDDIPLGQPTMIYQSADKTFEYYVWFTRDQDGLYKVDQLFNEQ